MNKKKNESFWGFTVHKAPPFPASSLHAHDAMAHGEGLMSVALSISREGKQQNGSPGAPQTRTNSLAKNVDSPALLYRPAGSCLLTSTRTTPGTLNLKTHRASVLESMTSISTRFFQNLSYVHFYRRCH